MFDLKAFREQSLPTQAQIISQWEGNLTSPLVSVICTAYNQESYIEDALKGFLMQKTDFPFEIIIHDDASTDKTADIINGYAKKYPLIIKPILQKNNQYSINGHLPLLNTIAVASGEYLALCEGDDFWIDENKLQKQILALEKRPDMKLCFTTGLGLTEEGITRNIADYGRKEVIFSTSQVIRGGGSFMPTASLLIHRDVILNMPDWFHDAPVGDYYIQVLGSMDNGALYLPFSSCCYRVESLGSWSSSNNNIDKLIKFRERGNKLLKKLSIEFSQYQYSFNFLLFKSNGFTLLSLLKQLDFSNFLKYLLFLIKWGSKR